MRSLNDITGEIVDAALKVHRAIGPGLLESVYERLLQGELARRGIGSERQKSLSFDVEGMHFERALRLDLLVEQKVAVEVKAVEHITAVHKAQLLTYIRLLHLPAGLLINFGGLTLREGLHRLFNDPAFPASSTSRHRRDDGIS
jgi:iron complex transport system substrate-binding protein